MAMTNYRDLSTLGSDAAAGFQFEFFCEVSGETWRSPFRPYRRGQLHGLLSQLTYWFNGLHGVGRAAGYAANAGMKNAKAEALAEALEMAASRFRQCPDCQKWVLPGAWDERGGHCVECAARARGQTSLGGGGVEAGGAAASAVCPNCQTPSQGGRFCHECGFDMASAFKSCPSCGATLPRQARFCTDCGHGF